MKVINKSSIGKLGEDIAAKYLQKNGYKIIIRNFHKRYSEIDIIAKEEDTLVFIEVKTRMGDSYGLIQESITKYKLYNLKKAIQFYLYLNKIKDQKIRADMVGIEIDNNDKIKKISHYKNIIN